MRHQYIGGPDTVVGIVNGEGIPVVKQSVSNGAGKIEVCAISGGAAITLDGEAGEGTFTILKSGGFVTTSDAIVIDEDGNLFTELVALKSGGFTGQMTATLTANRFYTLPDKNGTLATMADIVAGGGAQDLASTLGFGADAGGRDMTGLGNVTLGDITMTGGAIITAGFNIKAPTGSTSLTHGSTSPPDQNTSALYFDNTSPRTYTFPDASGRVATEEWVAAQGYGSGGGTTYSAGTGIDITGSTISVNATTDNIAEGSKQYFTQARGRNAISLTTDGDSGPASYDPATGVFNIPDYATSGGVTYTAGTGIAISGGNVISLNTTTDGISEGSTNKYHTEARARNAVSLTTTGSGAASYNATTGVLNVPTPSIPTDNATLSNGAGYITQAGARAAQSLTTTGTSGAAAYNSTTGVLNVPRYDQAQYTKMVFTSAFNQVTVAASTTTYHTFGAVAAAFTTIEAQRKIIITTAGVLRNLYVRTGTTQSSTGDVVITVRINGVAVITLTVAANTVAGTYSNLSAAVNVAAGDVLSVQFANAATAASCAFEAMSLELTNN